MLNFHTVHIYYITSSQTWHGIMWKSNLVRVDIFSGLKPLKHLCGWMGGDKSSYLWDWFWPETLCWWVRAPPPPGVQPTPPKKKICTPLHASWPYWWSVDQPMLARCRTTRSTWRGSTRKGSAGRSSLIDVSKSAPGLSADRYIQEINWLSIPNSSLFFFSSLYLSFYSLLTSS